MYRIAVTATGPSAPAHAFTVITPNDLAQHAECAHRSTLAMAELNESAPSSPEPQWNVARRNEVAARLRAQFPDALELTPPRRNPAEMHTAHDATLAAMEAGHRVILNATLFDGAQLSRMFALVRNGKHYEVIGASAGVELADGAILSTAFAAKHLSEVVGAEPARFWMLEHDDALIDVAYQPLRSTLQRITTHFDAAIGRPESAEGHHTSGCSACTFAGRCAVEPEPELDPPVAEAPEYNDVAAFGALPTPSGHDIYFDIEAGQYDTLPFLYGWVQEDPDGPKIRSVWAFRRSDATRAVDGFVEHVTELRRTHPDLHVFHFGSREITDLRKYLSASGHRVLDQLRADGVFVDIAAIAPAIVLPETGRGLKHYEALTGFLRIDDLGSGREAALLLRDNRQQRDPNELHRVARYNREDNLSLRRLHLHLDSLRPIALTIAPSPDRVAAAALPASRPAVTALHHHGPVREAPDRFAALVDELPGIAALRSDSRARSGVPDPDRSVGSVPARW
ncbi:MAG: ribonuclease H-like domain-containing protein [Acidimicrobiia bacterium]